MWLGYFYSIWLLQFENLLILLFIVYVPLEDLFPAMCLRALTINRAIYVALCICIYNIIDPSGFVY